ncbi:hypothetical protein D7322_15060 [Sphingobacterium puteale]|uniref:Uncharacterized protein n=1 Tax=Sphingobacterium puteale TaxID=2420510 RepID=A0A420VWG8_9SPHI|nr:hypothetical protein [Sphingobacterium puteale]RKO70595.1 hypothetical protein D7322_15060 [Sphingobacterium puteale]
MGFLNEWCKDLFQIIAALGSLGTLGAFLLLFKKDEEKQKQLNALISIAGINEKRLKYQAAPKLWLNGASSSPTQRLISIDLNNKGKRARLLEFKKLEGDFTFKDESLPWDIEQGERRYIFITPNNQHPHDTYYKLIVFYNDDIGNSYQITIEGTGSSVKIISDEEIANKNK